MPVLTSVVDEILELKERRRAVILAHHYQESEIQELADAIGDSLELARKAQEFTGDVIAFCGVKFMAETQGAESVAYGDSAGSGSRVQPGGCLPRGRRAGR